MPTSPLKILIVEDAEFLPELMRKLIEPLRKRFPESEIVSTPSLLRALEILSESPPPDAVTLDLTLSDSDRENTMAHLESIERRSPVVLITGSSTEKWQEMLTALQVEVIDKGTDWLRDNVLVKAIVRAITRGRAREAQRVIERLKVMERVNEELSNAGS